MAISQLQNVAHPQFACLDAHESSFLEQLPAPQQSAHHWQSPEVGFRFFTILRCTITKSRGVGSAFSALTVQKLVHFATMFFMFHVTSYAVLFSSWQWTEVRNGVSYSFSFMTFTRVGFLNVDFGDSFVICEYWFLNNEISVKVQHFI